MAANNRRLHALNPEKTEARREKYKQRLESAEGSHTDSEIYQIRKRLNDLCFYCGDALQGSGEKDHIVPLSKGGSNWACNITLACLSCNRDKYNKSVLEFVQWRQERGLKISKHCLDYLRLEKRPGAAKKT
ncbi:MAG: HNH endonuclease [Thiobacillus sp.]|nr:HNH endonuclease [Thiobacillus sp.]